MKFHTFVPAPANSNAKFVLPWAEKVKKESNGEIITEMYYSMQLGGKPPQLVDQVREGVVDIVWTVAGYTPGRFPRLEAFELPFLPTKSVITSQAVQEYVETIGAEDLKDYKYFVISIIGFLLISSFFAAKIGNQLVSAIFGSMVLLFVITNSLSIKFEKIKVNDVKLQFVFGGLSGLIGGITSLWALPITIYLFIKDVSPKHFVDVSGFFILMGCFPVFLGYYSTDVLSNEMFKYGLMGALFSLIGFYIGEKIRGGIKKDLFKKLLLIFFTFIAIKMIFDAFFK